MKKFKCSKCGCKEYTIEEGKVFRDNEVVRTFTDYSCDRCYEIKRFDIYSEHIMRNLRQRLGIDANDLSQDEEIMSMGKETILDEYLNYEGLIGYGSKIKDLVENIWGIELE